MTDKTLKIQMVVDHSDYKKGQTIELEEKSAITLLTNGKALKIHRKISDVNVEKTDEKLTEISEEKIPEIRKSKK